MNDRTTEDRSAKVPPGEGERRAQRGYVPQYDLGARVIYQALASGRLQWIGLADRGAGAFDDIVLSLHDRIAAYQVKTSRDPEPFSIKTILLRAENLLGRMLESRRKLIADHPNVFIETIYACDDYPRTDDNLAGAGESVSSAAFIRAHEAHRVSWTLADWLRSRFGPFVAEVQDASGLDAPSFEAVWRNTRFHVGGQGRVLGLGNCTNFDDRRLAELAAVLPRLVADCADRDRWSVPELLRRLGWQHPFGLKHTHAFPVDALYQSNAPTEDALQQALSRTNSGYVSLIGPPGSGKSTLLAAGLLPTPRAVVIRYLAFVPDEGQGLGRAEAFDFLNDVIKQLKQHHFGADIIPGTELAELRTQLEVLLGEACQQFRNEQIRTLIVIDGLDHVPREERPQRSFLSELPLPQAVPDGVIFVLGTQRLDLDGIPPSVRDEAQQSERCVQVSPLSREAVTRLADMAGVPDDVGRDAVYARSSGHPLSTRYVVEALLNAGTPEERQEWLRNALAYGGEVDAFYERAWHDLEKTPEAQQVLAYVTLAEGPISPLSLDVLVSSAATDKAWNAACHLLARDHRGTWAIFHNSFRLFLRDRTGLRHGRVDRAVLQQRYTALANVARCADKGDPQRWMELRYRARAGDQTAVAALARPERFRTHFIEGRNPADIRDDIRFAFKAAGALRRPDLLVELILSLHEIYMRAEALGDVVFDAFVGLGEHDAALGLLQAEGVSLSAGKGYELVDAFLSKRDLAEARKLFYRLEPLDELFGSKALERHSEENGLSEWAERALVFRTPDQFLAALSRLRAAQDHSGPEFDIDAYRTHLKLLAARGELERHHSLSPDGLLETLQIGSDHLGLLLFLSARSAFQADDTGLVTERLESALQVVSELEPALRSEAALIAVRSGLLGLAAKYLDGVPPPTLAGQDFSYGGDQFWRASRQIIRHAQVIAWLGVPFKAGQRPPSQLLASYQSRLETLGWLLGNARRGSPPYVDPLQELRQTLDFLEHATGTRDHDSERWRLDEVMHEVVAVMVSTAAALGEDIFAHFVEAMDKRLTGTPRRLGRSVVRRSYALATFDHEHDAARAELRLAYDRQGIEQTPSEQLAEAARAASVLIAIGMEERARAILADMHNNSLGYSRPAKKDAQYVLWQDLLTRACEEDASGRPDRLRFLGRLLAGMAKTEGDGAGSRVAPDFLKQAAQAGSAWAQAAADLIGEIGMADWPDLVSALIRGVVDDRPDLTAAAGVLYGRLALPWTTERDSGIYPQLIGTAPTDQVESVVRHAVACLETDGHPSSRTALLREVVTAAKKRGIDHGADAVARWSTELAARETASDSDDPFATVATLEELASALALVGDKSAWGAVRAFERIAPESGYEIAKKLYETAGSLRDDERSIEAIATTALAAGRRQDAISYLAQLKQLAQDRGDWSGALRGDAKKRFHRLNVKIGGEVARRAAFDAFVGDLANGRESVFWLLPELCDVLELISPQPTWANAWAVLQDHLSQFRECRLGRELNLLLNVPDGDEHTLANVLFRAIDTTSSELARMARAAALELTQTPGGAAIVGVLLPRLWRAGGHHALEAAQIAWECRDNSYVRNAVVPWLSGMLDSEDCAVRRTAVSLASAWGQQPTIKRRALPPSYTLMLPSNPQASKFEPPSGTSAFSSGLWTEDPFAWTWPLEDALKMTASTSGLELANLRARTAQLMQQMGGKEVFGPEAIQRQLGRLDRLGLKSSFHKLGVTAAFAAMRQVVGELVAAESIDPLAVSYVLRRAGAFAPAISTRPASPRPRGVPRAAIPDLYRSEDSVAWRGNVQEDAVAPTVGGYEVLASTAVHKRRYFKEEWIVEQYSGPNLNRGGADQGLSSLLGQLPRVIIANDIIPLYDGPAEGAVAYVLPDIAGSVCENGVMLCPVIAAMLGWHPEAGNPFAYRDSEGNLVAQTLHWRDGGVLSDVTDRAVIRRGCVLMVRQDHAEELQSFLFASQLIKAWRITQKAGGDERVAAIGSREVDIGHDGGREADVHPDLD